MAAGRPATTEAALLQSCVVTIAPARKGAEGVIGSGSCAHGHQQPRRIGKEHAFRGHAGSRLWLLCLSTKRHAPNAITSRPLPRLAAMPQCDAMAPVTMSNACRALGDLVGKHHQAMRLAPHLVGEKTLPRPAQTTPGESGSPCSHVFPIRLFLVQQVLVPETHHRDASHPLTLPHLPEAQGFP